MLQSLQTIRATSQKMYHIGRPFTLSSKTLLLIPEISLGSHRLLSLTVDGPFETEPLLWLPRLVCVKEIREHFKELK